MMPLNTHVLNSPPLRLVSRVTPLTTAAQQVVLSFAVAGLTGYLMSQIASNTANAEADANPLNAVVAGYGDTFFLSACLTTACVALSLLQRKPQQQQEEEGTFGGDS
ncbi:hypothetical protein MT396_07395 [Paenibacillus polymyxa]|nr:hypothetical protein [Paenibacillus polymyxa]MCJ1219852.1 hypothetical protein [Paenibacillus polymyxa]